MLSADLLPVRSTRAVARVRRGVRAWWWIAAAFLGAQLVITCFAANGPFVDEALYTVAGIRVLEGKGATDGYLAWFNGSPFAWPVMAAIGHRLGGLPGARLAAVSFSLVALVGFAKTAETLFGESAANWGTAALSLNGLFVAFAHFAVYDVPALAGLGLAMWGAARYSAGREVRSLGATAVAFALAVICKYGYVLMALPVLGLLLSTGDRRARARGVALFGIVAGSVVAAYFALAFASPFPGSAAAYFEQTFPRSRGHIAGLQLVFGAVPLALATVGAAIAWRRGRWMLTMTCLSALLVYPVFHLWTGNFVSGQKHVVPGFLFGYLLAGVALDRSWRTGSRAATGVVLAFLAAWGGVQWYWQEHSWSDTRALTTRLVREMKRGERVIADSSWTYILALYPAGLIESPADVIDASFSPNVGAIDVCGATWVVGDLDMAASMRHRMQQCGYRSVLSSVSRNYYFDARRVRLDAFRTTVTLYRLTTREPATPREASSSGSGPG